MSAVIMICFFENILICNLETECVVIEKGCKGFIFSLDSPFLCFEEYSSGLK